MVFFVGSTLSKIYSRAKVEPRFSALFLSPLPYLWSHVNFCAAVHLYFRSNWTTLRQQRRYMYTVFISGSGYSRVKTCQRVTMASESRAQADRSIIRSNDKWTKRGANYCQHNLKLLCCSPLCFVTYSLFPFPENFREYLSLCIQCFAVQHLSAKFLHKVIMLWCHKPSWQPWVEHEPFRLCSLTIPDSLSCRHKNVSAIKRFRYIEVLFHIFYYYQG